MKRNGELATQHSRDSELSVENLFHDSNNGKKVSESQRRHSAVSGAVTDRLSLTSTAFPLEHCWFWRAVWQRSRHLSEDLPTSGSDIKNTSE